MDEQRAGLPAENIEPETADPVEEPSRVKPRRRWSEWPDAPQAVAEPDGLEAAVGAVNGRLMEMTLRFSTDWKRSSSLMNKNC